MPDLGARLDSLELAVKALAEQVFGDVPGHPFHGNQWTDLGGPQGDGIKTPIRVSKTIDAVRLLGEGKKVELRQPRQVSTLLDKLHKVTQDMIAKGAKAPVFDLCNVSVRGTNLFCAESKGIPRIQMPQLKGPAVPGSAADKLGISDKRGETDVTEAFLKDLQKQGVKIRNDTEDASFLKATQNQLDGAKVAGIAEAVRAGKLDYGRTVVSNDNYIVDGHHRWAAQVGVELGDKKDMEIPIARVNMNIIDLLGKANAFASKLGIPQAAVGGHTTGYDTSKK